MNATQILKAAVAIRASDVHLATGLPPVARVDGQLLPMAGFPAMTGEACKALVYSLLSDALRAAFERDLELDASLGVAGVGRFRLNALLQRGYVEAVLRVIPPGIPSPEELGLGPSMLALADLPRGLVLVTGPAGSGKSTTTACLLDQINQRHARHIVTIEDPIEFLFPRRRALVRQREVGGDTKSFGAALRHALREDPDVIFIGELRDLETISLALTAAETGHLCFATLHTLDAAQTVDRVIDAFPPHQQSQVRQQLSNALKAVIAQVLLPRREGPGRLAAREFMVCTPAISHLIRDGKTHMIPGVIETGGDHGMFTLDRALLELVRRGAVARPSALGLARNHDGLAAALAKLQVYA